MNKVLDCISTAPSAAPLRQQAPHVLAQFKFEEVYISGLTITVNRFNNPPSAIAEFMVRVSGSDKSGSFPYNNLLEKMKVTLQRENDGLGNDRWLILAYEANGPGAEGVH